MRIVPATTPDQLRQVRRLFEEYAASLSFDLCFQNFQEELDGLPGDYAPPEGGLWLATSNRDEVSGCVALRRLEPGIGEMKRLYVRPGFRRERTEAGVSIGRELAFRIVEAARACGHRRLRLDTIGPQMEAAIKLYRTMGFTEIAPYYPSPVPGTVYMELVL